MKKKKKSTVKPLLKNVIYATKGAGMTKRRKKSGTGSLKENQAVGKRIAAAQREAKIQARMKAKKITYAQAAIELMDEA